MATTRSTNRNQNQDDASSMMRINICDPWPDLHHDVLFLVMMKLGVIDFLAFSRVCKPWRSFALSNKNKFIVSRVPMSMHIYGNAKGKHRYLKDIEGRKLKTIIPYSVDRKCVGVTCGYLILYREETHDFWLVNPITRHELHFPNANLDFQISMVAILVFSPSISRWVFHVFDRHHAKIWFSIAGKREWTHFTLPFPIHDIQVFKGKIYALAFGNRIIKVRLFPTPNVTLLDTNNFSMPHFDFVFVSSSENLCVMDLSSIHLYKIQKVNSSKMELVLCEKAGEEYAFFHSDFGQGNDVIRAESRANLQSQYMRYVAHDQIEEDGFVHANMWYLFHDCLNVNLLQE